MGWRGAVPEHAARGLSRSRSSQLRERRAHLRLQLLAPGAGRGRQRRRARLSGHLPRAGRQARRRPRCVFASAITPVHFDDLFQGPQDFDLTTCGDVVVRRRDGLASYQLAVVVDDAFQEVTRVVRGADLLASTPWQLDLQSALGAAAAYLRTPAAGGRTRRHQTIQVDDGAYRSITRKWPKGLQPTLTLLSQTPPAGSGAVTLLKMCGNGHLRTGTRKRLRAKRQVPCPSAGDRKQKFSLENCGVLAGVLR